ncbi:MAG: AbrB/MazE/SpoVT family DNA-binding domain-containing protein [Acidobacteriales bacterium]|nr:AbrB/MazE/SpoVT family DNA-binding domain-containing protein [Terriglobales bacterium]
MTATLTLDKAGRVVLPKPIRDELRLGPGDRFAVEVEDQRITLVPVRRGEIMGKERGVWVYRTGDPLPLSTVNETLRQIREDDRRALAAEAE